MNVNSSAVLAWAKESSSVGVGFVRSIAEHRAKVSFWVLPATLLPSSSEKSLKFTWNSGELSVDIAGADCQPVTAHEIPSDCFLGGTPRFHRAFRFAISTAERLLVFKVVAP
jgi:hypothetical protein